MSIIQRTTAFRFKTITHNVYEAVMVISQRARQINEAQHKHVEELRQDYMDTMSNADLMMESESEFVAPRFTKPTNIAVQELLDDELEYEYRDLEEEQTPENDSE